MQPVNRERIPPCNRVDHQRFGALLRHYRTRQGVSQIQLADDINLTPSNISRWEAAKRSPPDRATVLALGEALDLEPRDTNLLLAAAGYMQVEGERHRLRRSVAALAGDHAGRGLSNLPAWDSSVASWRSCCTSGPAPCCLPRMRRTRDRREARVDYERLLDHSFELHTLTRMPILAALGRQRAQQSHFLEARVWYERAKDAADLAGERAWSAEMSVQIGNILRTLGQREALSSTTRTPSTSSPPSGTRWARRAAAANRPASISTWASRPHRTRCAPSSSCATMWTNCPPCAASRPTRPQRCRPSCSTPTPIWAGCRACRAAPRKRASTCAAARRTWRGALHDHYRLSVGHRLLGDDYENRGDLEEAEANYREALEHCAAHREPGQRAREQGKVERGLGATLTRQARYDEAAQHLTESLAHLPRRGGRPQPGVDAERTGQAARRARQHGPRPGRPLGGARRVREDSATTTTRPAPAWTWPKSTACKATWTRRWHWRSSRAASPPSAAIAACWPARRNPAPTICCCARANTRNARILYDTFFDTVMQIGALGEHAERLVQRAEHLLTLQRYAAVQELAAHLMVRCQEATATTCWCRACAARWTPAGAGRTPPRSRRASPPSSTPALRRCCRRTRITKRTRKYKDSPHSTHGTHGTRGPQRKDGGTAAGSPGRRPQFVAQLQPLLVSFRPVVYHPHNSASTSPICAVS